MSVYSGAALSRDGKRTPSDLREGLGVELDARKCRCSKFRRVKSYYKRVGTDGGHQGASERLATGVVPHQHQRLHVWCGALGRHRYTTSVERVYTCAPGWTEQMRSSNVSALAS